jgi:nicotinate phosphoribosyltransferase
MKLSTRKETLPGSKQVWRRQHEGRFSGDLVSLRDEPAPPDAAPLLVELMTDGSATRRDPLELARRRAAQERELLDPRHRTLAAEPYPVETSAALRALRDATAAQLGRPGGG